MNGTKINITCNKRVIESVLHYNNVLVLSWNDIALLTTYMYNISIQNLSMYHSTNSITCKNYTKKIDLMSPISPPFNNSWCPLRHLHFAHQIAKSVVIYIVSPLEPSPEQGSLPAQHEHVEAHSSNAHGCHGDEPQQGRVAGKVIFYVAKWYRVSGIVLGFRLIWVYFIF